MRELKFRGKCAFSGVYRYGYFYISKGNHIIRDENDSESIVISESVGEFTGITDKKGKEVYENDKCKYHHSSSKWLVSYTFEVIFKDGSFYSYWQREMCGKLEHHWDLLSKVDKRKFTVL
jgi:hypothetical protein